MPQDVRGNPLPLPDLAGPRLLESCHFCGFIQQPLDLPRGEVPHTTAFEDVPAPPTLQVCTQGFKGRPGDDAGALLAAIAVHHMQVSAGAVQVLGLQGSNLRDAKATAGHEPEESSLSRGGGSGEEAVPLLKGEEVFGVHAIGGGCHNTVIL